MARKKGVESTSTVDDEGHLRLEGAQLWKWRALDAELRAATAELESLVQLIQIEIAKNPELSAFVQRKAALMGTLSVARSELTAVQTDIEKDLGVSLKDCTFDDKTGRLYNLAADGSQGEPVVRQRKKTKRS